VNFLVLVSGVVGRITSIKGVFWCIRCPERVAFSLSTKLEDVGVVVTVMFDCAM